MCVYTHTYIYIYTHIHVLYVYTCKFLHVYTERTYAVPQAKKLRPDVAEGEARHEDTAEAKIASLRNALESRGSPKVCFSFSFFWGGGGVGEGLGRFVRA